MSSASITKQFFSGHGPISILSDFIVRPPRAEYKLEDLSPQVFSLENDQGNVYYRQDLELQNMRGLSIKCSWYKRMELDEKGSRVIRALPCVVYCHGNCGSRCDAAEAIDILKSGFTLFTFDFCGCGMSDGDYISLGHYERQDLAVVLEYLEKQKEEVRSIAIWGRSMGAVTAIMYAAKDPFMDCIVCDSPFSSLEKLMEEIVAKNSASFSWIVSLTAGFVRKAIRNHIIRAVMFDIYDINTLKFAEQCKVPVLLLHGRSDDFVSPEHSERLSKSFPGECVYRVVEGGHNDQRDMGTRVAIADFLIHHCT